MSSNLFHTIAAAVATLALGAAACGGESSARGEKSGGASSPVTLRIGTVESNAAPYADEVERFAESVGTLSDGSIEVEIVWEAAGPFTGESERILGAMAQDGEIDLAVVATRAWDQLDVSSMQALQAPFLVDSVELVNEIAEGDLAADMLAGLDEVGVSGLAMWPESLRHPIGFDGPLLTAADFRGAQLRVPLSDASYRLANAIGAEPVDPEDWDVAVAAGELDGAESAFVWALDLPRFGTFTANITFYPKVNTIVANTDVFESLPDEQQDVLRQAATDTLAYVVASNDTEHDLALKYCADGGSVAIARESDLAELAGLAEPVLAELSQDADTARVIDGIRALKDGLTINPAAAPVACGAGEAAPISTDPEAGSATFPEGTYRAELDYPQEAEPVVATLTLMDGTWVHSEYSGDCGGDYVVESGRIRMTLAPPNLCGEPAGGLVVDAAWAFEDGELSFVDFAPEVEPFVASIFGSQPWTQIEGASDADPETTAFPEGVYRVETANGVFTNTLLDGVWEGYTETGELDCAGTYVIETGRIWMSNSTDAALACGNPPGLQFLDAAWTFEDGELRFVDINSDPNAVRDFGSQPWTLIEPASDADAESTTVPDGSVE